MSQQHRSMYMPASSPYSTVPKLKQEGFDVPLSRALSRQDGSRGPGQHDGDGADDSSSQRPTFDGSLAGKADPTDEYRQLQHDHGAWNADANSRSTSITNGSHKFTLPYPSASSFPSSSFAAASAAEIDDALSSLVGSFPAGRLSFDHPSGNSNGGGVHSAFSYPQSMADLAPTYSLNPQSLNIPQPTQTLHASNVDLGGRTSTGNSPNLGGHSLASFSPHSALTSHSLFDSYKAVPSSSNLGANGRDGSGHGGFASLSYTDSITSPATSVSLSSCHHPSGGGGGSAMGQASGNSGGGGSSLRSRSRSSIRDHREAAASAPTTSIGIGGRVRIARRGSINSEADRLLSPAAVHGGSTLPSTAGGTSGSDGHHRRVSSIIIPSTHNAGLGLGFQSGSLPAYGSQQHHQQQQAAGASWVFSPTSEKGELPLVRENDSGDEELEEMNRVDDDPKHDALAEKRRRRRESHNAVERRRRDTINEKISELSTLLPACMLDPARTAPISAVELASPLCAVGVDLTFATAAATADDDDDDEPLVSIEDEASGAKGAKGKAKKAGKKRTGGAGGLNAIGPDGKPNKGIVLKKSVQYIRYLHQIIQAQAARTADLESMLHSAIQIQSPPSSVSQPSVSASDASASPTNGYAPSQMSHGSNEHPAAAANVPGGKSLAAGGSAFPSLQEMLADADDKSYVPYGVDVSMRSGGGLGSHTPSSYLANGQTSTAGSGISSPNLFPWSANPGSPPSVHGSRPDTGNMLADHPSGSSSSTSSRRELQEDEIEERGRGRGARFLSGSVGEGWGQIASSGFRGFDERGHLIGAMLAGGDAPQGSRPQDVTME